MHTLKDKLRRKLQMSRFTPAITTAIFILGFSLASAQPLSQASAGDGEVHEITVTATKYEFNPNPIRVKKGERVKLIVTAQDHDHGFQLEAFNIQQEIKKGTSVTVEFTADRAGTFPFHCSKFCGFGHRKMKGTLVVEE
jgi:cytochrome c oxidase subunit 2